MIDLRIAASLINKFFGVMQSNKCDADSIARNMLANNTRQNQLAVIVNSNQFVKSTKLFTEAEDSDVQDLVFPKIEKNEFRLVSLGNYQPKLALSYINQQIKLFGKFRFYIFPQENTETILQCLIEKYSIKLPVLVMADFRSRFRAQV